MLSRLIYWRAEHLQGLLQTYLLDESIDQMICYRKQNDEKSTFDAMAHLRAMPIIYKEHTLHRSRATSSSLQTLPTFRPTLVALLLVSISRSKDASQ